MCHLINSLWTLELPYIWKIWQSLNLAIFLPTRPYKILAKFLIWRCNNSHERRNAHVSYIDVVGRAYSCFDSQIYSTADRWVFILMEVESCVRGHHVYQHIWLVRSYSVQKRSPTTRIHMQSPSRNSMMLLDTFLGIYWQPVHSFFTREASLTVPLQNRDTFLLISARDRKISRSPCRCDAARPARTVIIAKF